MRILSSATRRLGLVIGFLCAIGGFVVSGPEAAVIWFVVGYFLGKSIRSMLRTLTRGPAT
jgi:hypothetical protein